MKRRRFGQPSEVEMTRLRAKTMQAGVRKSNWLELTAERVGAVQAKVLEDAVSAASAGRGWEPVIPALVEMKDLGLNDDGVWERHKGAMAYILQQKKGASDNTDFFKYASGLHELGWNVSGDVAEHESPLQAEDTGARVMVGSTVSESTSAALVSESKWADLSSIALYRRKLGFKRDDSYISAAEEHRGKIRAHYDIALEYAAKGVRGQPDYKAFVATAVAMVDRGFEITDADLRGKKEGIRGQLDALAEEGDWLGFLAHADGMRKMGLLTQKKK